MGRPREHKAVARRSVADKVAIGASLACMVHCLFLPVAVALIPAAAGLAGLPEGVHLLSFVIAVPVSAVAIIAGYRRHGAYLPGAVAAIGLVLIGVGALAGFALRMETGVTLAGSLLLAAAHIRNRRTDATRPIGGTAG